jgi:transcriptional regulator with XRE-family HTH domain
METLMLGEKLRSLREGKSWSQAHLAEAARLNIRTVQRIEGGEPASDETLLSLAAALGVDVSELQPSPRRTSWSGALSRGRVALAIALIAPAALFVALNLLRSLGGVAGPYEAAAGAGAKLMSFHTFNLVSPLIFLGGPAIAFVLCLPALVRLRTSRANGGVLSITGLDLRRDWRAVTVIAAAALSGGTLLLYALLETLRTPLG